ncbi:MAG: hypothetical protein L0Z62_01840 [Gemmataceae bacterium]|nr:hypothetical protein [Gemmataceae bacterium]
MTREEVEAIFGRPAESSVRGDLVMILIGEKQWDKARAWPGRQGFAAVALHAARVKRVGQEDPG